MPTRWITAAKGIRYREHNTRLHGRRPDRYWVLQYKRNGKVFNEAVGWWSDGIKQEDCEELIAELRKNWRSGQGPQSLLEMRAEAEQKRKQIEANRIAEEKALLLAAERPTLAKLWESYARIHSGGPSWRTDKTNFGHLKDMHGKFSDEIKTKDVDALRDTLIQVGKKPQTIKHILGLLRRLLRFGVEQEFCEISPHLQFKMPKVDNQKTECLTPKQVQRLMKALAEEENQNLAALVRLALATGMRRGALFGLQWNDIDFDRGFITLRGEHAKKRKTETIPLTNLGRAILEQVEHTESTYVFPGKFGDKPRTNLDRMLRRVKKKAQLPKDFRPLHGLRHTYASWLASSGSVDIYTLQRLLTHESPQMTARYAHLQDEAMKKAGRVADKIFSDAADGNNPLDFFSDIDK